MTINDKIVNNKMNCVINHLQGNRCITTKTGILRSLDMYYRQNEMFCNPFLTQDLNNLISSEVLPTCFILSVGVEDTEYANFVTRFSELEKKNYIRERIPSKHCKDNWWLIKPANMNQGR